MLNQLWERYPATGELALDAMGFLRHHCKHGVADHVERVAREARRIAAREGVSEHAALAAAYLHDISLVLPYDRMVETAEACGIDLLPEERQVPTLIHGKLSAVLAAERFGVTAPAILDAIRCHSTLRPKATLSDKVLFVADKLSWDPKDAPYRHAMVEALECSLDDAVRFFLLWSWEQRQRMPVVHPWLQAACTSYLETQA